MSETLTQQIRRRLTRALWRLLFALAVAGGILGLYGLILWAFMEAHWTVFVLAGLFALAVAVKADMAPYYRAQLRNRRERTGWGIESFRDQIRDYGLSDEVTRAIYEETQACAHIRNYPVSKDDVLAAVFTWDGFVANEIYEGVLDRLGRSSDRESSDLLDAYTLEDVVREIANRVRSTNRP